jgi:hypothetical protein
LIDGLHTFFLEVRAANDVLKVSFHIGIDYDMEGMLELRFILGDRAYSSIGNYG